MNEKPEIIAVGEECVISSVYDTIHVYPQNDVEEHNTTGIGVCWCEPFYDSDTYGNRVCIHQLFDSEDIPGSEALVQ